jgi:hypothetical protein
MSEPSYLRSEPWMASSTSMPPSGPPEANHPSTAPPASRVVLRASAPLTFELSGDTSVVIVTADVEGLAAHPDSGRDSGCEVTTADGIATWADASTFELTGAHRVMLSHNLPSSIDLRPLLGQTLRVTLVDEVAPNGTGASQTLSISGASGRVWLVARFGPVRGVVHTLGTIEVRAALSQRSEGPLVVGTEQLQWLVAAGCHVRLGAAALGRSEDLVVEHITRPSLDSAAYLMAETAIYVG